MKRIIALVLTSMLALGLLAACGGTASSTAAPSAATPAPESTSEAAPESAGEGEAPEAVSYTVGLIQLMEHTSLNEIREAIESELTAWAGEKNIDLTIDYQNAQGDNSLINSICRQFVNDKVDVIVAIATPAAQGAATATEDIPIIFSAISDPIAAGLLENLESPEGNVTGTSDAIDVERIFQLAGELTPGIETFGLLYNKGEANSVSVIEEAKTYLDSIGVKYVEKTVVNTSEVQQTSRALLEECDAVFSPIDNTVATAMGTLADEAIRAGKPVYVAADSMVQDGGLATVGVNYTQLGKQTANMAMRVLTGTPISEIPVEVLTEVEVVVNAETAEAIDVDVSKYLD